MILSASFSKPRKDCTELLGRPYIRIKIRSAASAGSGTTSYKAEWFTKTQAFHTVMQQAELESFIASHAGTTFLNCVCRTETQEITILGNKKGHITRLEKKLQSSGVPAAAHAADCGRVSLAPADMRIRQTPGTHNRVKNYILAEGTPVPFLVHLGIMTPQGKVIAARYDKFRQINRFLEYIRDIMPELSARVPADRPLRVADFGCGKSYLTFAVHYYLTQIEKRKAEIIGLDLKQDVIDYCTSVAEQIGCTGLRFATGDIAGYEHQDSPDLVITLHACDTATDYALHYAVTHRTTAILSVPCCQHQLNAQLDQNREQVSASAPWAAPLLKYGLIKERFAALATDALRASYLEAAGYTVQVLEFIDAGHTPKNLLIRAVRRKDAPDPRRASPDADALTSALGLKPELKTLLEL